jgi:hypothetical protein
MGNEINKTTEAKMARKQSRCKCGKVKSQYSSRCRKCQAEYDAKRIAEAVAVVSTGVCPDCGSKLKRNLALTGWWCCEQRGAETHRARPNDPPCEFQTFTA